jgi:hypothetical protein
MSQNKRKTKKRASSKKKLLDHVIQLTGLPSQVLKRELQSILLKKNIKAEDMTLEQLRSVATSYLREIMGPLLNSRYSEKKRDDLH